MNLFFSDDDRTDVFDQNPASKKNAFLMKGIGLILISWVSLLNILKMCKNLEKMKNLIFSKRRPVYFQTKFVY